MSYHIEDIALIIKAEYTIFRNDAIGQLVTDSRKIIFPNTALFFALLGTRRNGEDFIEEVYNLGVRNFVVSSSYKITTITDANFLKVENPLTALQTLAAHHRKLFNIPIIGITGSNGKTIVKEWLFQLLENDYTIARSPRSYNSQIGVPLSVCQLSAKHTLGIFEAGISTISEMQKLQNIIQPTLTVITNIGTAHSDGFTSDIEKATEKYLLANGAAITVYNMDSLPANFLPNIDLQKAFSWSRLNEAATLFITGVKSNETGNIITAKYQQQYISINIPFSDTISTDNAITCWATLLSLGYAPALISERMKYLHAVEMRMQLKKAINNCHVINDSYSNDVISLSMALDYLIQQAGESKRTVILSDIYQSGTTQQQLYAYVAALLQQKGVHRLIAIGNNLNLHNAILKQYFSGILESFPSTNDFLNSTTTNHFKDEFILLKGARVFEFERINQWLEQKLHQTVLEINLSALVKNLNTYKSMLSASTKIMAMVKAFSYGSGSAEIARVLQFHSVDYLAVAYTDEGIALRKEGIRLPIMVMSADESNFSSLIEYSLEPELFSFPILTAFQYYLKFQGIAHYPVHIKLDTGMHRLGFEAEEVDQLCNILKINQTLLVKSVFSHLTSSEDSAADDFTLTQAKIFETVCNKIETAVGYTPLKHLVNSAAISRHPNLQYDMVRLGIGLYGIDPSNELQHQLETVATLKTTIAQIRKVKAGEAVGYGRKHVLAKDSLIATVRIGYADGYSRGINKAAAYMIVHGKQAPVVGNICMDMTMLDVTSIDNVQAEDEVEVFGNLLPVQQLAKWNNTISYEIMTGIGQRVKRIYTAE